MTGLTERQSECLAFIRDALAVSDVSPSFGEIGEALGLASKSGVHRLVHGLAERGYIKFLPDRRRTIALAHQGRRVPFSAMAEAVAEHFFDGDAAKSALVRKVLISAWRDA